ncbi:MAG: 16S rRNA (guanine(527)-N(7))-methyltransferase RsmG [Actinomycetota bacterium]
MITARQRELLERFAAAVRASPHNLVSPGAREVLWERHVLESVAFSQLLPVSDRDSALLDVGSGGGFPGIVIAIMRPDLSVTLLDARQKKVTFLRHLVDDLHLSSDVLHGRAEELARQEQHRARYDLVTARAVAPMTRLLPWTIPFLAPGGLLYAIKGDRWREELEDAVAVLRRHRARVVVTPDDPAPAVPNAPRTVIVARDPSF